MQGDLEKAMGNKPVESMDRNRNMISKHHMTALPAQHVPDTLYLGVNKANAVFLLFKFKINSTLLSFSVMLRQKVESSGSVKFS